MTPEAREMKNARESRLTARQTRSYASFPRPSDRADGIPMGTRKETIPRRGSSDAETIGKTSKNGDPPGTRTPNLEIKSLIARLDTLTLPYASLRYFNDLTPS